MTHINATKEVLIATLNKRYEDLIHQNNDFSFQTDLSLLLSFYDSINNNMDDKTVFDIVNSSNVKENVKKYIFSVFLLNNFNMTSINIDIKLKKDFKSRKKGEYDYKKNMLILYYPAFRSLKSLITTIYHEIYHYYQHSNHIYNSIKRNHFLLFHLSTRKKNYYSNIYEIDAFLFEMYAYEYMLANSQHTTSSLGTQNIKKEITTLADSIQDECLTKIIIKLLK